MNKVFVTISIFLLALSCNFNPTEKQQEFARKLLETPGILKAEWGTTLSLRVTVDLDSLGRNPSLQAQQLADQIAAEGLRYTDSSICANIYYGNGNFLAESCLNR